MPQEILSYETEDPPRLPPPVGPERELIPDDDGWLEFDDDGVPLGRWSWDDDLEEWVFDPFPPPLSMMPTTGIRSSISLWIIGLCISLIALGFLYYIVNSRRKYTQR